MKGKYIFFVRPDGLEYPVLFPDSYVAHLDLAQPILANTSHKVISAGFFSVINDVDKLDILTYGESISLKVSCRPCQDSVELARHFGIPTHENKEII